MGQVPFGIVGDGRLARHLIHYFNLLRIPYRQWSRQGSGLAAGKYDPSSMVQALLGCQTVLLAVSDSAIEYVARDFLASYETLVAFVSEVEASVMESGSSRLGASATSKNSSSDPFSSSPSGDAADVQDLPGVKAPRLIHFSGALVTPLAMGMHPLMTFTKGFYELADYQKMAFVCEEGEVTFQSVFPQLKNPNYTIKKEQKAFYHALCVMSGNFSVILWQKLFEEFQTKLGIPAEAAFPYLERISRNLQNDSRGALTGPLQRKDMQTIHKNLEALDGDSFRVVYQAFATAMGVSS
jgi:Domain of unknown function (DUF2520)